MALPTWVKQANQYWCQQRCFCMTLVWKKRSSTIIMLNSISILGPGGRDEMGQVIYAVAQAQGFQQWDLSVLKASASYKAEGQTEARDARFYPPMLMAAGVVYEDRSQPQVFLFTAFKVSVEPVMIHLLLSYNKANYDFFFLLIKAQIELNFIEIGRHMTMWEQSPGHFYKKIKKSL